MIAGLCESPLTFQAIIIWRDELNDAKALLRDIIDLEATYAGPDAKAAPKVEIDVATLGGAARLRPLAGRAHFPLRSQRKGLRPFSPVRPRLRFSARSGKFSAKRLPRARTEPCPPRRISTTISNSNISLSAMEAELKPRVLEIFDRIADDYKKLRRLQDQTRRRTLENTTLTPAQERKYKKLKQTVIADVKSLSLHNNRIETLVEQLYDINKRLVGFEGRMMRLAESHGVQRTDFLKHYQGGELDPKWILRVSKLGAKGWKRLIKNEREKVKEIRSHIHDLATETGLEISEFRKIVAHGAERRAGSPPGQKGDGRGQSAPRDLDRQEIHQSRPAVPGPDPGGQYRPDEGGRQIRVPARLQVLDLCHLVDQAGDHPLDRRPGAHHPHPGAHDRDDQQDRANLAPDAA